MSARRRIVVVGAGSCGCVVAERLTRDDTIDVVLLEAGPDRSHDSDLTLSMLPIGPTSDRVVHHTATGGFDLPRGRGVGGSSVVNGGYFMRRHAHEFAQWDQRWWDPDTIARTYTELDGGNRGGGAMSVRRFVDDELHPRAHEFESYWARAGYENIADVVPAVGINRVRSNSTPPRRVSADRAYLDGALGRPNLTVRAGRGVDRLVVAGDRVTGVQIGPGERIDADETILCAGTLSSASLISRSTGVAATHRISEHRELLVRFRPGLDSVSADGPPRPLLPTVLHTADGVEIRCYNGDFADFIDGVRPSGPAVGIALMTPRSHGALAVDPDGRQRVDLGDVDPADEVMMRSWAATVVEMLDGDEFAGLVETGTAAVDSEIRTSQHAWGTLPMGSVTPWAGTDWTGSVAGVESLRVIDGSILPDSGCSGPHETLMMMAGRIAQTMVQ